MLSLYTTFLLGLCVHLPSFILGDPHPPQSAYVAWRWKDEGNSNPEDMSIFTGEATATWVREARCTARGEDAGWDPNTVNSKVDLKAASRKSSKDFMDPQSIRHWVHYKDTFNGCDTYHRTDFTIYRGGDRSQRMILRFPDICTDESCKGPNKERPNVQCLFGPKGRVVMYLGKWIDECFER